MTVGSRLKTMRTARKLSRKALAEKAGVSAASIRNWELNNNAISIDALIKLTGFFATTSDYLLGITDDPKPPQDLIGVVEAVCDELRGRAKYAKYY